MNSKIVLQFALISDIHFSSTLDTTVKAFYKKALERLQVKTNNTLDAVIVAGDFSEGYLKDYFTLINYTKRYAGEKVPLIASYGNHEGDGKHHQYEEVFGLTIDNVRNINGFNFVCIGAHAGDTYLDSQAQWLDEKLSAFAEKEPTKSVFILIHHPVFNTHTSNAGNKALSTTLTKYSQAFVLTGHDHSPFCDKSFWRGEFISFRNSYLQDVVKGEFALITVTDKNIITINKYEVNLIDEDIKEIGVIEFDYNVFLAK